MTEAVIGLDVGTTVAKAVLFDLSGSELHVAGQAYAFHTPQPGWAELEPDHIWQAVVQVLRAVAEWAASSTAVSAGSLRIRAIGLATQGGTLIPCKADGTPTYRAITWMDARSEDLASQWWAEGVGDRVRQISGWSPEPGLPLLSIAWLRQARPEVFAATERFLSVNDYLAYHLTGRVGTNPSMAGEMLLTDMTTGQWSAELCSLVGIGPENLSPIHPSDAPLGKIRPEVTRLTGLDPQTVLINGGQDHSCEALALGMTSTGAGMLACGTAWVINGIAESPSVDSIPPSMNLNYHVVPGRWVVSRLLGAQGACLEWWLNQCGWQSSDCQGSRTRDEAWASFNAELEKTTPGSAGLVYFSQTGVRQSSHSIRHGGFVGLRLNHSRADMGRAMLEGAAYELRWALERLRRAGMAIEQMWMVGGAAQSPFWPQIVADVTGVPISLTQYTHGPALGAAILAGLGLGVFDSVEAGLASFRVSARQVKPGDAHAPVYDKQFAAYRRMTGVLAQ